MKKILIVMFILFSINLNAQEMKEYMRTYQDTSNTYKKWIKRFFKYDVELNDDIFHYEIKTELKDLNAYLVYTITDNRYDSILNETRIKGGSKEIIHDPFLDSIADNRVRRLVNLLIAEDGELIDKNSSNISNLLTYDIVHGESIYRENAQMQTFCGGPLKIYENEEGDYISLEGALATVYLKIAGDMNDPNIPSHWYDLNVNKAWNKSKAHYNNRIDPSHKYYGYSIAVVEYKENSLRPRMILAYEVFRD